MRAPTSEPSSVAILDTIVQDDRIRRGVPLPLRGNAVEIGRQGAPSPSEGEGWGGGDHSRSSHAHAPLIGSGNDGLSLTRLVSHSSPPPCPPPPGGRVLLNSPPLPSGGEGQG